MNAPIYGFLTFINVLYITQVLAINFPLKLIYSQIAVYTKYFVLTFSVNIVYPLSNKGMKMKCNYVKDGFH